MFRTRVYIPTLILVAFLLAYYVFTQRADTAPLDATPVVNPLINQEAYVLPITATNYFPILNSSIPEPTVSAKAFLVFDTQTDRILYSRNTNTRLPVASLTKVMTAMVAFDNFQMGEIVTIASGSVKVDGERQDLYLGEKLTVLDLIQMLLIKSSNDAAFALAEHGQIKGIRFVEKMNEKAFMMGMSDSLFFDPAGLQDDAYSTVSDLKKMISHAYKNYTELWSITNIKNKIIVSADGKISRNITSTNKLFDSISGIKGGKTGYTDGALGCMILIKDVPNEDSAVVSVVLGSTGRFEDTRALVDWIFTAYKWK